VLLDNQRLQQATAATQHKLLTLPQVMNLHAMLKIASFEDSENCECLVQPMGKLRCELQIFGLPHDSECRDSSACNSSNRLLVMSS
jgi:hypothetical protein